MRKFFVGVFLTIIFLVILGVFLFEKEIDIIPKIKPKKVFKEFIEKTEKEIQEKKETALSHPINSQEVVEGIIKKNGNNLKNEENIKNIEFTCEKIRKDEVSIKFKEFFLKLEIELESKEEKDGKCLTLISINKLIDFKKDNENIRKEDFEFLKRFLEGKKIETLISKSALFEILRKIENKEEFIF